MGSWLVWKVQVAALTPETGATPLGPLFWLEMCAETFLVETINKLSTSTTS
jgi:hypothetical protein